MSRNKREEAIVHLRDALELLCADTSGTSLAAHFINTIMPGCELKLGGPHARDGRYAYYLTLPRGSTKPDGWWMYNPNPGYFWTSGTFDTKEEATRQGLIRLLSIGYSDE